ncbi:hypothetical protein RHMOL_Rhmol11G0142400 [Rhododendron molle]|uniref:Uncharacterized protein n=1 Tax=Rhododendron molle TaxID=49168 RepID=A0ACC0LTN1_RHOML|nr:hypothetical protein RHMOL_Rhmol11G0142400 [Rhododendron molle]
MLRTNPKNSEKFFNATITRFPSLLRDRTPEVPLIGLSLLATQTKVFSEILLYHIPTYLRLEFPGLKNPSAKVSTLDTKTSPSLMNWVGVKVSMEVQNLMKRNGSSKLKTHFSGTIVLVCDLVLIEVD